MTEGENLKCWCGKDAKRKESSKKGVYYGCSKQSFSGKQCGFYWAPPPVSVVAENALPSSSSSSNNASLKQRSLSSGSILPPPTTPTPDSSVKRTHSTLEQDLKPQMAKSQKRTKVLQVEAVLNAASPHAHAKSTGGLEPVPLPLTPSQKRTKIIEAALKGSPIPNFDTTEAPPRPNQTSNPNSIPSPSLSDDLSLLDVAADSSDLAVQGTQGTLPNHRSSLTVTSQDLRSDIQRIEDGMLSQQRQVCSSQTVAVSDDGSRDTSVVNDEEGRRFGVADVNEKPSWMHGTPARKRSAESTAERARFAGLLVSPASPTPPTGTKGKHKAIDYGDAPLLVGDRRKVFELVSEETPSTSQETQYSAASISRMVNALEGIPCYVNCLEKSNQIKDMRIKHLENEVDRLKTRQEELESMLEMYE